MLRGMARFALSPADRARISAQRRAYLARTAPIVRKQLSALRRAIRAAAPEAVEVFSYGIPGFRWRGERLLWYAAWKTHTSLYPVGDNIRRALGDQLKQYKGSTGTVQFPLDNPPSATLVRKIVKARIAQIKSGTPVTGNR